jgi:Protein kinase domain
MDQELWRRVETIFHAALERAPEGREAFLDGACNQDTDVRRQVELLLSKAEQAGSFLEKTPLQDITVTLTAAQSLLGRQIGPYQIVSPLGAGGMGEVYRAHDSKLGRDVAIKTLPREFARDPERLARFRREARTLASLNHPNIAAIYGLEESGDVDCLVMELVEGETLAARLQKGRLPMAIVLGKSIVYASNRNAAWVLVERPANGIGPETILTSQQYTDRPTAVSHDGLWLVLMESTPLHSVIALRSRRDPSKVIRIQDHGLELDGSISRDGRWLLYSSVPATRREVLVQSVPKEAGGSPDAVGKWQISTAGGSQPAWRADGKEIFHVAPDGMMMATPVESSENFFRPGTPKALFQTRLDIDPEVRQYDVTADGQRFLLNQRLPDNPDSPITVVFNWPKLLEKGTAGR